MTHPASTVLMIRPTRFGFNSESAATNSFQKEPQPDLIEHIQQMAQTEFDEFVINLEKIGVEVIVYDDFLDSETPDSIFPNNWFSTHDGNRLILYPMAVKNRRKERRSDIIIGLKERYQFQIEDLTFHENERIPLFLEGTGSLIFDPINQLVFAAISERTSESLVGKVAEYLDYRPICFRAFGKKGEPIYHTNVMMSIGVNFVAIGMETIHPEDKERVQNELESTNKSLCYLTNEQVYNHFAGNVLQIANKKNEKVLVVSKSAMSVFTDDQLNCLKATNDHILAIEIPTIESVGGGSVRCMLAEINA